MSVASIIKAAAANKNEVGVHHNCIIKESTMVPPLIILMSY